MLSFLCICTKSIQRGIIHFDIFWNRSGFCRLIFIIAVLFYMFITVEFHNIIFIFSCFVGAPSVCSLQANIISLLISHRIWMHLHFKLYLLPRAFHLVFAILFVVHAFHVASCWLLLLSFHTLFRKQVNFALYSLAFALHAVPSHQHVHFMMYSSGCWFHVTFVSLSISYVFLLFCLLYRIQKHVHFTMYSSDYAFVIDASASVFHTTLVSRLGPLC